VPGDADEQRMATEARRARWAGRSAVDPRIGETPSRASRSDRRVRLGRRTYQSAPAREAASIDREAIGRKPVDDACEQPAAPGAEIRDAPLAGALHHLGEYRRELARVSPRVRSQLHVRGHAVSPHGGTDTLVLDLEEM
jgi:hypothetical protein